MDRFHDLCCGQIQPEDLPVISPKTLYFFICSAYTDFELERRILTEKVYPELKDHCRRHYGLELEIIDPRPQDKAIPLEMVEYREMFQEMYGHYCKSNIDCCTVILLGQKFGLPLLPTRIGEPVFELLCQRKATKRGNQHYTKLAKFDLRDWYELDANCLPTPQWVLKPLEDRYPELMSEDYELRLKATNTWNRERDLLVYILYYYGSLCVQESQLSPDAMAALFVCELSDAVSAALGGNNSIEQTTEDSFAPIVLQRKVIDLNQYLDRSDETFAFTDVLPTALAEPGQSNRRDPWLLSKLSALQNYVLRKLSSAAPPMRILWRKPWGLDRKFHQDYLEQFANTFKQSALHAIDMRASQKRALLYPPEYPFDNLNDSQATLLSEDDHISPVIQLKRQDPQVIRDRELQRKIQVWDNAWNSIATLDAIHLLAEAYRKEVQTVHCYMEDSGTGSDAPMFLYTTRKPTGIKQTETNQSIGDWISSSAVAASAFIEAQKINITLPKHTIMIARVFQKTTDLNYLLRDLQCQLSYALNVPLEKLPNCSLATLLNSVGSLLPTSKCDRVIILLCGIDHVTDGKNSSAKPASLLLPVLLSSEQLPYHLRPGVKLILTAHLSQSLENNMEPILLPLTSLNLEVLSPDLPGAFSVCAAVLAANNRRLSEDQLIEAHRMFQNLSTRSDLLWQSQRIALASFYHTRSTNQLNATNLIDWVGQDLHQELNGAFSRWFGPVALKRCLEYLQLTIKESGFTQTQSPGLTTEEVVDLCTLDDRIMREQCRRYAPWTDKLITFNQAQWHLLLRLIRKNSCSSGDYLLVTTSLDGYFVHSMNLPPTKSIYNREYGDEPYNYSNELLLDYFTNTWYGKWKPLWNKPGVEFFATPVLSQGLCYAPTECTLTTQGQCVLEYNPRYLRHIPLALHRTNRFVLFGTRVLFNISWLYATVYALGTDTLLDAFHLLDSTLNHVTPSSDTLGIRFLSPLRLEVCLLADALNRSVPYLMDWPAMLPLEITGQLLSFSQFQGQPTTGNQQMGAWITSLIRQCDQTAPWLSAPVPVHSYPIVPGNPLVGSIACPKPVDSLTIRHSTGGQGSTVTGANELCCKLQNDPKLYRYDCERGCRIEELELGHGRFYCSPSGQFGLLVDHEHGDTIKVYRLDVQDNGGRVPLMGQIHVGFWIHASRTEQLEPMDVSLTVDIVAIDLTDTYVAVIAQTPCVDSLANRIAPVTGSTEGVSEYLISEDLSPGMVNHVMICELTTGKLMQLLSPKPRATFVKLVKPDLCLSSSNETQTPLDLVFTNAADELHCFHIITGQQLFSVNLGSVPKHMCATSNENIHFLLCRDSSSLVKLQLTMTGMLDKSEKVSFEKLIPKHDIHEIIASVYFPLILLYSSNRVIVYDFETDAVITRIDRPSGIPHQFRQPNSNSEELGFTAVQFALRDQLVAAAIFRHVILWDVRLNVSLMTLNAPIGLLTRLLIDRTEKQLVGYADGVQELYLWNIPLALTQATLAQQSFCISGNANRMDHLTQSVMEIAIPTSPHSDVLLARCDNSDELGVFDRYTGRLIDLYTHDHVVQSICVSACGQFALIGLYPPRVRRLYQANLIWSLATRRVLVKYGQTLYCTVAAGDQPASFFQIVPNVKQETDEGYDSTAWSLLHITIETDHSGNHVVHKNAIDLEITLNRPRLHGKPFVTCDDNRLILLTQLTSDDAQLLVINLTGLKKADTAVPVCKITSELLSNRLQESNSSTDTTYQILSCYPVKDDPDTLFLVTGVVTRSESQLLPINWIVGTGMNKTLVWISLLPDNDWSILRVLNIPDSTQSNLSSFHLAPKRQYVYDAHQQRLHHLDVNMEEDAGTGSVKIVGPSQQPVRFHGFILDQTMVLLSDETILYLVRLDSMELVIQIPTKFIISTATVFPCSGTDHMVAVGFTNGYLQTYLFTDRNAIDKVGQSIENLVSRGSQHCLSQRDVQQTTKMGALQTRARSWDRELEMQLKVLTQEEKQPSTGGSSCLTKLHSSMSECSSSLSDQHANTCMLM